MSVTDIHLRTPLLDHIPPTIYTVQYHYLEWYRKRHTEISITKRRKKRTKIDHNFFTSVPNTLESSYHHIGTYPADSSPTIICFEWHDSSSYAQEFERVHTTVFPMFVSARRVHGSSSLRSHPPPRRLSHRQASIANSKTIWSNTEKKTFAI